MSGRRLVRALLARFLPGGGRHRAPVASQPVAEPSPRRPRLPRHKSPYAHDAACGGLFMDTLRLVRPYLPAPYISPACHVGTHVACDKGSPEPEAVSVPGIRREVCACGCHEDAMPALHHLSGFFVPVANTVPSGAAA